MIETVSSPTPGANNYYDRGWGCEASVTSTELKVVVPYTSINLRSWWRRHHLHDQFVFPDYNGYMVNIADTAQQCTWGQWRPKTIFGDVSRRERYHHDRQSWCNWVAQKKFDGRATTFVRNSSKRSRHIMPILQIPSRQAPVMKNKVQVLGQDMSRGRQSQNLQLKPTKPEFEQREVGMNQVRCSRIKDARLTGHWTGEMRPLYNGSFGRVIARKVESSESSVY